MSKLVTQRFEYVNFDDAQITTGASGVITSYPAANDQYSNNSTASAGSSYGTANITTTGSGSVPLNIPAGSTVTMIGAATNTVNVSVGVGSTPLTPGGVATALAFPVAPSQIVTLPGVFNTGSLAVSAVTSAGVVSSTPVSVQLLWSV